MEESKEEWVLWKVQDRDAPLLCLMLPCLHLLRAQLSHMECVIQLSVCVLLGVRKQHALGSGVPRRSMHGCACARTACAMHPYLILTNQDSTKSTSFQA